MNGTMLRPAAVAVVAVLFLALQLLVDTTLSGARLDLTENGLYTLTDGSRNIARKLDEPMTLQLHVSSEQAAAIPIIETYATRVRELLEEYVASSGGMLELELYDPEPFSEEEDLAVGAGLRGVPVNAAGDLLYFGLVVSNTLGDVATIPFFDPSKEAFLEYDISRLIHQLGDPTRPVVGLLSSLPIEGAPSQPVIPGMPPPPSQPAWYVVEQMRELFDVRSVAPDATELPDDLDVLMLVHPQGLSDELTYAIDQFVLGGGRALVFVDPHCEEQPTGADPSNPLAGMGTPRGSDLAPLLQAWGVSYDPEALLGDRDAAMAVVSRDAQGQPRQLDYVAWLRLQREAFSESEAVTAGLGVLSVAAGGVLRPVDGASTTFTPLVQGGPDSAELSVAPIRFMPDPERLLLDYAPAGSRLTLAARVHGPASTAFPGGLASADDHAEDDGHDHEDDEADTSDESAAGDDADGAEHLAESVDDIHVIVVADADMLADSWWVEFGNLLGMRVAAPSADNGDFVINCLDSLGGSADLIEVRSRGEFERPFTKLDELRREAELAFLDKEQALQADLRETERRLSELQRERDDEGGNVLLLSDEQQAEIERFREKQLQTRKELREVRHELRKDIESTQAWLKFANILGVPLLLLLASVASVVMRKN